MNRIFVTSDTHFDHAKIIGYCGRPFKDVDEMNSSIVRGWNASVGPEDRIYVLGDFVLPSGYAKNEKFERLKYFTSALNGEKHLVMGNHDKFSAQEYLAAGFASVTEGFLEVNECMRIWVMCHYQMTAWNKSHRGSFHLYGHEHAENPGRFAAGYSRRKYNVGMDLNGFRPVELKYIAGVLSRPEFQG